MPNPRKQSQLFIVGTPLSDEGLLSREAIDCINQADFIIAESKRNGFRFLKQTERKETTPVFFLDPFREREWQDLKSNLKTLSASQSRVVLFSDTGMPLLFDPGSEILKLARELNYSIHSVPSATSWGSACALSGWAPPFLVLGFLPREMAERKIELNQIKGASHHTVLLDTPYRFEALISQIIEVMGGQTQLFLAWEIAKPEERLIWGSAQSIQREAEKWGLKKGEFILIIQGVPRVK